MRIKFRLLSLLLTIFLVKEARAQVSGLVYQDFNANGTIDSGGATYNDAPYEGVIATAFDPTGAAVGSATSDASGIYTIAGVSGPLRIEFTYPASSGMMEGAYGGTSVQFVEGPATDVNYGLSYAGAYCQDNPPLTSVCYQAGPNQDGTNDTEPAVVRWSYNNSGLGPDDKTIVGELGQVGSCWGIAYNNVDEELYTSAVLNRHMGLNEPEGLDAIYMVDPFGAAANATAWVELDDDLGIDVGQALVPSTAVRDLGTPPYYFNRDPEVFEHVGEVGIGDIDLSDDMKSLFVMNMFDKTVYEIEVASKTVLNQYPITTTCDQGEIRPWALKYHKGELYAGAVCDASLSGNDPLDLSDLSGAQYLTATVYKLVSGAFVPQLTFDLDYAKQGTDSGTDCRQITGWYPWSDSEAMPCLLNDDGGGRISYPQPILSDIEFDVDNDLILGFLDRSGLQYGNSNRLPTDNITGAALGFVSGGDILRACYNGTDWDIEDPTTSCSTPYTVWSGNGNNGPDARQEWYGGDWFHTALTTTGYIAHMEVTYGGLESIPGLNEVASVAYDPVSGGNYFARFGVLFLDNTTGERTDGFQLGAGGQGKGVGLGDLEALCESAHIEIGNRVWWDMDSGVASNDLNGVQDANEPPIPNVTLELWLDADGNTAGNNNQSGDEVLVATTMTDSRGRYLFSYDGNPNSPVVENWVTANDRVMPNSVYQVRVADWDGSAAGANSNASTLDGFLVAQGYTSGSIQMSPTDTGAGATAEVNDSDGYDNPGNSADDVSTGLPGDNDHSHDFGFGAAPPCEITAAGEANLACDDNGTGSDGTDDFLTIDLNPTGNDIGANYNVSVSSGTIAPATAAYGASTSFTITDDLSAAADVVITISDEDDASCEFTLTITDPNPCSTPDPCSITAAGEANLACDDNGTNSDGTDDFLTIDLNPTGSMLGANYSVSVSSGTIAPASAAYGAATSFTITDDLSTATDVVITITDDVDATCQFVLTITDPNPCSTPDPCSITAAGEANLACDDNGTGSDDADDFLTIDLNPTASMLGANYSVSVSSGTIAPASAAYGAATSFTITDDLSTATDVVITITDDVDATCQFVLTITDPNPCSTPQPCNIVAAGEANLTCDDNGTGSDGSDDFLTIDLNPSGSMLGTNYSVSVSSGTISPASAAYGAATSFTITDDLSAASDVVITITDDTDASCEYMLTLTDPEPCSDEVPCPDIEYELCAGAGESYTMMVETDATNIQWYFNGDPIDPADGGNDPNLIASLPGEYYYTATGLDGCDGQLCCPFVLVEVDCCPAPVCISGTMSKN